MLVGGGARSFASNLSVKEVGIKYPMRDLICGVIIYCA